MLDQHNNPMQAKSDFRYFLYHPPHICGLWYLANHTNVNE